MLNNDLYKKKFLDRWDMEKKIVKLIMASSCFAYVYLST